MRAYFATASMVGLLLSYSGFRVIGEEVRSVQTGVYSVDQAKHGEKVFEKECLECHPPDEFTGTYMDGWAGLTAFDFVEIIRKTMPENNPGGLKRQDYIDIVAYIFEVNGLPAGESKMVWKALKEIRLEGPFGQASGDSESNRDRAQ